jgi:hypothetical protein
LRICPGAQFFCDPNTVTTREHRYCDGSSYAAERRNAGSAGATGFGIRALCTAADLG